MLMPLPMPVPTPTSTLTPTDHRVAPGWRCVAGKHRPVPILLFPDYRRRELILRLHLGAVELIVCQCEFGAERNQSVFPNGPDAQE